ncbi:MAG: tyrosine-protein phosphatase [Lachnospiraceae bacterium]
MRNDGYWKVYYAKDLPNTRDLGGYETRDGKVIKRHKLIRSGTLYNSMERYLEDKTSLTKDKIERLQAMYLEG